jgi:CHAD domain-containing protein
MNVGDAFVMVANPYRQEFDHYCHKLHRHSDAETVHRMRIAIRRLLTAVSAFTKANQDPTQIALKVKLHRLQEKLNELRDIDVWLDALPDDSKVVTANDFAALRKTILRVRRRNLACCRKLCGSRPYRVLGADIQAWISSGAWRSSLSLTPAKAHARQYLTRLDNKIRKTSKCISKLDDAATHKLRIRVKKARYATEVFAQLFKSRAGKRRLERYSEKAQRLQSALGALTDLASRQRLAKDIFLQNGISQNAALAFFAGVIVGQEIRSKVRLSKAAQRACDAYRESAPRYWH